MVSPSFDNDYTINNESDNSKNNIVTIIKLLFINIRNKLLYKRLTQKAVQNTCEFFIFSLKHIISKY